MKQQKYALNVGMHLAADLKEFAKIIKMRCPFHREKR
jgi:hypothetical protein